VPPSQLFPSPETCNGTAHTSIGQQSFSYTRSAGLQPSSLHSAQTHASQITLSFQVVSCKSSPEGPSRSFEGTEWASASGGRTALARELLSSAPRCDSSKQLMICQQQSVLGPGHGEQTWGVVLAEPPSAQVASMPPLLEHAESCSSVPSATLAAKVRKSSPGSRESWGHSSNQQQQQQQQQSLNGQHSPVVNTADHHSSTNWSSGALQSMKASPSPVLQRHVTIRYVFRKLMWALVLPSIICSRYHAP
jgi:hypothetical protein